MKTIRYMDYTAHITYSDEKNCFVARVTELEAITLQGESITKIRAAFHRAVDSYLTTCAEKAAAGGYLSVEETDDFLEKRLARARENARKA